MSGKSGWCLENRHETCKYGPCKCDCHDHGNHPTDKAWAAVEELFEAAEETMKDIK